MFTTTEQNATDKQLIEWSLAGNSDAFGQLVRKYQDQLFTSLCHVAGLHGDSEEITQDAFVQAYLKLATFRQRCEFYTWLYRIALNLLYTRGRRNRTRACLSHTRPINEDDRFDPHGTPLDELQRREQAAQIREALNALSEEHRTILVLRGVEGFASRTVRVSNEQGLHLRPCSAIVSMVGKHRAQVLIRKGSRTVSAASIFDLLSLAAPPGTELVLLALGSEAGQALEAVAGLFATGFQGCR